MEVMRDFGVDGVIQEVYNVDLSGCDNSLSKG